MMKRAPVNVRYLWLFGEHILTRSFAAPDQKQKSLAQCSGHPITFGAGGAGRGGVLHGRTGPNRESCIKIGLHRPSARALGYCCLSPFKGQEIMSK